MKLIAYPESKLEPKKIVVYVNEKSIEKGDYIAQIYSDGSVAMGVRCAMQRELDNVILIRDNFFLFYENIENVNNQR